MTHEEAIKILHPDSTFEALTEIEYYNGFNGREAKISAVNEACILACEALEKQMPKKVITKSEIAYCPHCGIKLTDTFFIGRGIHWCSICGNAIDWSDDECPQPR